MRKNRLFKIFFGTMASASLLASSSAYATLGDYANNVVTCPRGLFLEDGFYMGAQLGYDSFKLRAASSFELAPIALAPVGSFGSSVVISENGLAGGIFAGFGMYLNERFYLGGEVFMNNSGASQSQNFTVNTSDLAGTVGSYTKVSAGPSWGISLLPGWKVNNKSRVYVRFGYNQAYLRSQSNYAVTSGGIVTSGASAILSQWQGGFNYGLGIETAVYPNVSIRTEYSHTGYESFADGNGTINSPSDNQLMVSLIYHFT
ncbi:MAG: outer membrane beta-barrel protein [Pseudomonadota bacterium]